MISTKKVLIIGPAWIGDAVMTQVPLKLLKKANPNCIIDVAAPSWTLAIFESMPEVNAVISLPFKHGQFALKERYRIGKLLRDRKYDQAIIVPNSLKSALIPFFACIPQRTGFHREGRGIFLTDARRLNKKTMPLMIDRLAQLAIPKHTTQPAELPWPEFQVKEDLKQTALQQQHLNLKKPVLVMCPGAEYGPSKRWPTDYFAEVARIFAEKGWQIWLMGSQKDKPITEQINASACIDLAGKTNLQQAIALMSCAQAVLTNDTGLMHIAAALNKPIVALYGSSSPKFTPPLAKQVRILDLELECSPCFARNCPLKHHNCMIQMKPEMVIAALESLCAS